MKTYILQVFDRKENCENLMATLSYFMFEDKRNPLYLHIYENTVFIYTPYEFWNMNSISMLVRSHLRGDYFILYEINEYDGLLPSGVWEKKKDAEKYYKDKDKILKKYRRTYSIGKLIEKSKKETSEDINDDLQEFLKELKG